jgi:hypothetical protein
MELTLTFVKSKNPQSKIRAILEQIHKHLQLLVEDKPLEN